MYNEDWANGVDIFVVMWIEREMDVLGAVDLADCKIIIDAFEGIELGEAWDLASIWNYSTRIFRINPVDPIDDNTPKLIICIVVCAFGTIRKIYVTVSHTIV